MSTLSTLKQSCWSIVLVQACTMLRLKPRRRSCLVAPPLAASSVSMLNSPWPWPPPPVWSATRLHCPYQIVESEKILSRMIFQSQLWLLLLLSFWDYGHRVMTLCHQLFCRKIFHCGENEGGQQSLGSNLSTSQFELGIDCHLLVSERQQSIPCFISEMSVGCVMRVTWSSSHMTD